MRKHHPHPSRSRGFSFAEVMFAVVLLGLGFIMVAAIFPVAIRQQQASMEDTTGVAVAKQGAAIMEQLGVAMSGYTSLLPATPGNPPTIGYTRILGDDIPTAAPYYTTPVLHLFQHRDDIRSPSQVKPSGGIAIGQPLPYDALKGNLIQQSDSRFAWIPVAYQRWDGSDTAQVYLCAVQVRNHEQFDARDREITTANALRTFIPVKVYVRLTEGDNPPTTFGPDLLTFVSSASGNAPIDPPAAAEGAFVWIAHDGITNPEPAPRDWVKPGMANGRYYRLGVQRTDLGPGVWELQPGYDMTRTPKPGNDNDWDTQGDNYVEDENIPAGPSNPNNALGYLVGRGVNPENPGTWVESTGLAGDNRNFSGTAMPVFALPPITVRLKPQQ